MSGKSYIVRKKFMNETRKMQLKLLEMMKDFHEICIENDINYYIIGGTLLGAVRHKGFIPWDDDIDIGLPRNDYEKLLSLSKELIPDYFAFRDFHSESDAHSIVTKLYHRNTTLIERQVNNKVGGIYIDIFPLDGCGNNALSAKMHFKKIRLLKFIVFLNAKGVDLKGYDTLRKLINFFDNKKIFLYFDKLLKSRNFHKYKFCGNLVGAWGEKEILHHEIFGQPTIYQFEDGFFYGPEKPHEYLSTLYGEYMKLPPLDKQVSHHDFEYLNLELPYALYKRKTNVKEL
jgi:lipopolysaccharide cholinephosphotransferase